MVQPPSIPSSAEILTKRGVFSPILSLTFLTTSKGKRILFSIEPPYSSFLKLDKGDKKL